MYVQYRRHHVPHKGGWYDSLRTRRKPLIHKDLEQNRARNFDVSAYETMTYDKLYAMIFGMKIALAYGVPIWKKIMKSFVKIS